MSEFRCTPETPWDKSIEARPVVHPSANVVEGSSDYYEYYECPVCGHHWQVELPE